MKEHFAQTGDVGLIYTDEAGNYHILALSRNNIKRCNYLYQL